MRRVYAAPSCRTLGPVEPEPAAVTVAAAPIPADRVLTPPAALVPLVAPAGRRSLALAGLLVAVVLGLYGRVLWHPFVSWDDHVSIAYNPDFTPPRLGNLGHYWADWRTGYLQFYTPVLYTTWGVTAWATDAYAPAAGQPWAMRALPFHALSLAAHAGAALAAFALLRRLVGGRDGPAFVGAALFAVHPLQVEPVAWASTLYTPLSAALGLAALWQFLRFADGLARQTDASGDAATAGPAGRGPRSVRSPWFAYGLATALFAAALLTKPSVVALPLLAGVFEWIVRRRPSRRLVTAAVALLPWLALAGAITYVTSALTQPSPDVFRPPAWQRPLVAADALGFYLQKLVWPADLGLDYGRTPERVLGGGLVAGAGGASGMPWGTWIALAAVVGLTAAAAADPGWVPRAAAAWAAFVAGAVAALGLVPFEHQVYSTAADRYAYLAMFGPALAAAAGVAWLTAHRRRADTRGDGGEGPPRLRAAPAYAAAAVGLVALAAATAGQLRLWADGPTLFAHAIALNPDSPIGHQSMALELQALGRVDESVPYVRRFAELRPADPRSWSFLGLSLMRANRPAEAVDAYRRTIDVFAARGITPTRTDPWASLGAALLAAGRAEEAEATLRHAVARRPDGVEGHRALAGLYLRTRRPDLALPELDAVARLVPDDAAAQRAARELRWQRMSAPPAAGTRPAP